MNKVRRIIIIFSIFYLFSLFSCRIEQNFKDFQVQEDEVIVIPKGEARIIYFKDNSSWNSFIDKDYLNFHGVFVKDRKVEISPYVICSKLVTNESYAFLMNNETKVNNSDYPIEQISWYEAIAYCNELTKYVFSDNDCIYYSDKELRMIYTKEDAECYAKVFPAYDYNQKCFTKKGYRLPTEAEWEFAARGGNIEEESWNYTFSGKNCSTKLFVEGNTKGETGEYESPVYVSGNKSWVKGLLFIDLELREYANTIMMFSDYSIYSSTRVDSKKTNSLGLHDMSGNLYEWCWDGYSS